MYKWAITDQYPLHEFHTILNKIFYFEIDIINSRIIRLIFELFSTGFLCLGVWIWLRKENNIQFGWIKLFAFACLGILLSTSQRSISFYELSGLLVNCTAGLVFMQIGSKQNFSLVSGLL